MKRFVASLFIISVLLPLSACDISFDGDEKDKQIEELTKQVEDLESKVPEEEKTEEDKPEEETKPDVSPEEDAKVTETIKEFEEKVQEGYITLKSPSNEATFYDDTNIVFKGIVSPNTSKIVVTWKGPGSIIGEPTEDVYRLQSFKYGDSSFKYTAKVSYYNLGMGSNKYEFKAYFDDGTTKTANLTIFYSPGGAEVGKPVIYLYPQKITKVSVNVAPNGGISVSVPEIKNGWNVIAAPGSKIYNISDFKVYPYLFWEGFATNFERPKEGFVVKNSEVSGFFDGKLSYLGLNKKEIADFKEFWLPKLSTEPYYFITFIPQEQFDKYAPLSISPTPDSIIRVFFDYEGLSEKIEVEEQVLEKAVRKGFSVVEWGGRLY